MANNGKGNPQLEDGFTRIANELLEAIAYAGLKGANLSVLLYIIRRTYGFRQSVARITIQNVIDGTNLPHTTATRSLADLKQKQIIFRKNSVTGINKKYQEWQGVPKMAYPENGTPKNGTVSSPKNGIGTVPKTGQPIYIKENLKENLKETHYESKRNKDLKEYAKPTLQEVKSFCAAEGLRINASNFYGYYNERGWQVTDWKATARQWDKRQFGDRPKTTHKDSFDIQAWKAKAMEGPPDVPDV